MSSGTGIHIDPECGILFNKMKVNKKGEQKEKYNYLIFQAVEGYTSIKVTEKGGLDKTFDDLRQALYNIEEKGECCWAMVDFEKAPNSKNLILINWCPENAKTKAKLVNTASNSAINSNLKDGFKVKQANEHDDITFEALCDVCK